MAGIELRNLAHAYTPTPAKPSDYALQHLNMEWEDGTAYALLGPSGCGKTTLLNIVSGLLRPSHGQVLFDGRDVTDLPPDRRNIAQVFQFPVVYDTMTVYDNLAFPLRNRGLSGADVDRRVRRVAEILELGADLGHRARGLTADAKQKISMGRGLVRSDVAAILFDEPLTVIDPHMKWRLRRKLREVHEEFGLTLIYVTHDQVEAMTFADKVAVMHEGRIVQLGTPQDLFEEPAHTFVGYFIGSPGMNVLPCRIGHGRALVDGIEIPVRTPPSLASSLVPPRDGDRFELGIRPEFVEVRRQGEPDTVPAAVQDVEHRGTHRIVSARLGGHLVRAKLDTDTPLPADGVALRFPPDRTRIYHDGRLVT